MNVSDNILSDLGEIDDRSVQFIAGLAEKMPGYHFQMATWDERIIIGDDIAGLGTATRKKMLTQAQNTNTLSQYKCDDQRMVYALPVSEPGGCLFFTLPEGQQEIYDTDTRLNHLATVIELLNTKFALSTEKEEKEILREQFKRKNLILQRNYHKLLIAHNQQQKKHEKLLKSEIDRKTEALRNRNEALCNEIEQRKKALARADEVSIKAEKAYHVKVEFLSNISHELRTPINSLLGFTELLLDTTLRDEQREYLNLIKKSSLHLLELINEILDYSKIEAGKSSMSKREFDLSETLRDIFRDTKNDIKSKALESYIYTDSKLDYRVIGDQIKLRQILLNLVGNAVKFTENGYVAIRTRVEEETEKRVRIHFSVKDTGEGIPENKKEAIFTPFSQADGSMTRRYGGTGLGLSISNELVKLLGGKRIFVESKVGEGSNFFFCMSFQKGSKIETSGEKDPHTETIEVSKSYKILLVEDTQLNIKLASKVLNKQGHTVVVALNGQEAVDAVDRENFDVILMDIQMPVMDGLTATRVIRGKGNHTPIIAMTAGTMKSDIARCREAGMDEYISKPFRIKDIGHTIQQIVEKKAGELPDTMDMDSVTEQPDAHHDGVEDRLTGLQPVDFREALERLDGNREIFQELLRDFYHFAETIMPDLRRSIHRNEQVSATRLAHSLKGNAGSISANILRKKALDLEGALKGGLSNDISRLVGDIETALTAVLDTIRYETDVMKNRVPDSEFPKIGGNYLPQGFRRGKAIHCFPEESPINDLGEHLRNCDLEGALNCIAQIKECGTAAGLHEQIMRIEDHVINYEFEEADKILEDLL